MALLTDSSRELKKTHLPVGGRLRYVHIRHCIAAIINAPAAPARPANAETLLPTASPHQRSCEPCAASVAMNADTSETDLGTTAVLMEHQTDADVAAERWHEREQLAVGGDQLHLRGRFHCEIGGSSRGCIFSRTFIRCDETCGSNHVASKVCGCSVVCALPHHCAQLGSCPHSRSVTRPSCVIWIGVSTSSANLWFALIFTH